MDEKRPRDLLKRAGRFIRFSVLPLISSRERCPHCVCEKMGIIHCAKNAVAVKIQLDAGVAQKLG
jgi:hypothetical protein